MSAADVFHKAVAFVLQHEGGYVFDPRDPGGETKYGISKRSYPQEDIAALTRERATAIYRRDFWDKPRLGALPPVLGALVLDGAVNMGSHRAVVQLQAGLNRAAGLSLAEDGVLGPVTLAVANGLSPELMRLAAKEALIIRMAYYSRLAGRRTLRVFLRGWIKRVTALSDFLDQTFAAPLGGTTKKGPSGNADGP